MEGECRFVLVSCRMDLVFFRTVWCQSDFVHVLFHWLMCRSSLHPGLSYFPMNHEHHITSTHHTKHGIEQIRTHLHSQESRLRNTRVRSRGRLGSRHWSRDSRFPDFVSQVVGFTMSELGCVLSSSFGSTVGIRGRMGLKVRV